jgi:hypothetical protein
MSFARVHLQRVVRPMPISLASDLASNFHSHSLVWSGDYGVKRVGRWVGFGGGAGLGTIGSFRPIAGIGGFAPSDYDRLCTRSRQHRR